jgi:hypothetical protein
MHSKHARLHDAARVQELTTGAAGSSRPPAKLSEVGRLGDRKRMRNRLRGYTQPIAHSDEPYALGAAHDGP